MPKVSVVLATYNRLDRLKRVIASLEKQTYPLEDFEVVIVSDGSSDGTLEYLHRLNTPLHLTVFSQMNQGAAVARNHGVSQSCGELLIFIDDDIIPAPELISEHIRVHDAAKDPVVVLGPMLTPFDFKLTPWVRWEQEMLEKQYQDMLAGCWEPTARQFYTGNTCLGRQHFMEAGGFDPLFRRAEDVELAYRLSDRGLRFIFNPQAVGYHYAERSFTSWISIPYEYGTNDVVFAYEKGQSWLLRAIWREYFGRNILIRLSVWLCLDRPSLSNLFIEGMKQAVQLSEHLGLARLAVRACSGIFNLRQYQGIADQLGGRKAFYAGVASVKTDLSQQKELIND